MTQTMVIGSVVIEIYTDGAVCHYTIFRSAAADFSDVLQCAALWLAKRQQLVPKAVVTQINGREVEMVVKYE